MMRTSVSNQKNFLELMDELPEDQRLVLQYKFFEDLTNLEIASGREQDPKDQSGSFGTEESKDLNFSLNDNSLKN